MAKKTNDITVRSDYIKILSSVLRTELRRDYEAEAESNEPFYCRKKLYSEQTWYDLTVQVGYTIDNKIFEKTISIESQFDHIDSLYITCNKENPNEIYHASEYLDLDINVFLISVCVLLIPIIIVSLLK